MQIEKEQKSEWNMNEKKLNDFEKRIYNIFNLNDALKLFPNNAIDSKFLKIIFAPPVFGKIPL